MANFVPTLHLRATAKFFYFFKNDLNCLDNQFFVLLPNATFHGAQLLFLMKCNKIVMVVIKVLFVYFFMQVYDN